MVAKSGHSQGHAWTLAPCLVTFMGQADEIAPKRDRRTDGSIASARHLENSPHSDHNPKAMVGGPDAGKYFVTAVDLTHDPEGGMDCDMVTEALRLSEDHRVKYVIFKGRIFNGPKFHTAGARKRGPWKWGHYSGYSQHEHHLHLSVLMSEVEDQSDWQFPGVGRVKTRVPGRPVVYPHPTREANAEWLNDFATRSHQGDVLPASLSYLTAFIRELRKELGLPDSASAADVAQAVKRLGGG